MICSHPFLLQKVHSIANSSGGESASLVQMLSTSGKLAVLDMLLQALCQKRHRCVLFSQFPAVLDLLEEYCSLRGFRSARYDSSMTRVKRNYVVNAFNAPDSPIFIFLMSTRAGNLGDKSFLRANIGCKCILEIPSRMAKSVRPYRPPALLVKTHISQPIFFCSESSSRLRYRYHL